MAQLSCNCLFAFNCFVVCCEFRLLWVVKHSAGAATGGHSMWILTSTIECLWLQIKNILWVLRASSHTEQPIFFLTKNPFNHLISLNRKTRLKNARCSFYWWQSMRLFWRRKLPWVEFTVLKYLVSLRGQNNRCKLFSYPITKFNIN